MAKQGRNAPCPCGSGEKYKRCCLDQNKAGVRSSAPPINFIPVYTELDQLSNSVFDFIDKGELDEAEAAANKLLKEYPDQIDGLHRLSQVYEARGDKSKAVEYLWKTVEFAKSTEGFDGQSIDWFLSEINRLNKEL